MFSNKKNESELPVLFVFTHIDIEKQKAKLDAIHEFSILYSVFINVVYLLSEKEMEAANEANQANRFESYDKSGKLIERETSREAIKSWLKASRARCHFHSTGDKTSDEEKIIYFAENCKHRVAVLICESKDPNICMRHATVNKTWTDELFSLDSENPRAVKLLQREFNPCLVQLDKRTDFNDVDWLFHAALTFLKTELLRFELIGLSPPPRYSALTKRYQDQSDDPKERGITAEQALEKKMIIIKEMLSYAIELRANERNIPSIRIE